jgi:tetratricopeptide (TPR) repeat protein
MSLDLAEDGLALYEEAGDRLGIDRSLSNAGAILAALGRPNERRRCSTRLSRSRGPSTTRLLALALNNRGDVALTLGDWDTAGDRFEESLAPLHRVGDEVNVARSLFNLGVVELERGRSAEAREHLAESAERCLALDDKEDIAWCLVAFAAVHAEEGITSEQHGCWARPSGCSPAWVRP